VSKHEQYEELCTLAMIGEVSPTEMQDLRRHLGECADCRKQYREFIEFLLPQLSLASDNDPIALDQYTERESQRLRSDFFARAKNKGLKFSSPALDGVEEQKHPIVRAPSRPSRILWQLAFGTSVAGLLFAGGYVTHRERNRNQKVNQAATKPSTIKAPAAAASDTSFLSAGTRNPDAKTIADLEEKLRETETELSSAQQGLKDTQAGRAALASQLEAKNKQISSLESQVTGDAETTAELRTQAADLKRRMEENQSTVAANELRIRDLNEQLSNQTSSLDREREMLSVGRDVRDLMGTRSLHIIDVHDANGAGKNQKSFGRIFYTEGKSLIFYAFDLDDKRVMNANYSYEAWGERLGQPASVKSLGVLYVDDKAQRRWSLKVDDPRQLSEINSVFVTLEPRSAEGDKPRGKRILFAFLGGEANHP
jgi:hypothetical protein